MTTWLLRIKLGSKYELTARSSDSLADSRSISLAYVAGAPCTACWTIARQTRVCEIRPHLRLTNPLRPLSSDAEIETNEAIEEVEWAEYREELVVRTA